MNPLPKHVAIIMDGNGRWGKKNKSNRYLGHNEGIKNIKPIIFYCLKKKIKILTLFCFSIDNWKRKKKEVNNLFNLFEIYYKKNYLNFEKNKIKFNIIGENNFLPKKIIKIKKKINETTFKKILLKVNLAFNYSSKIEIINTFKKIKKINVKNFVKNLYLYPDPDPDILIRTGNTHRLSDFLLWQCSYTEIFFLKKLWPDFTTKDFLFILKRFSKIKRNYGSD